MENQDLLQTFAEVAVAFAGFSAVVSMFDRRADDGDPRVRHYRIRVMVEYSLCVSIFAFVPYLLNAKSLQRTCSRSADIGRGRIV